MTPPKHRKESPYRQPDHEAVVRMVAIMDSRAFQDLLFQVWNSLHAITSDEQADAINRSIGSITDLLHRLRRELLKTSVRSYAEIYSLGANSGIRDLFKHFENEASQHSKEL